MAIPKTYRGFSTTDAERTRAWSRYDIDLVKRDLMNHFHTRVGERVMRPEYGCRIWDYLYEQMDNNLRDLIIDEAERICRSDPRVAVQLINVFDFENGIRVEITLDFVGLAVMQNFTVDFERREREIYSQIE